MLTTPSSFNGKLVLEAYKHTELKAEIRAGWAQLSQKNNLKGLQVLVQAVLPDGTLIPAGSTAYLKEEFLSTSPVVKNKLKSDSLTGEFILVNLNEVEYVDPPKTA
jgi:hypothetical protein